MTTGDRPKARIVTFYSIRYLITRSNYQMQASRSMDHCTFGDATVSKLTSMHQITSKNYRGMWKSLLHSPNLVIFNFLVNSYRHLPRLYFVGTAGLRQPQSNWAIRLFTNNSPPKYSCHCSILIDCSMPLNERKFVAAALQGQRAIACAFSKSLSVDNCLQS